MHQPGKRGPFWINELGEKIQVQEWYANADTVARLARLLDDAAYDYEIINKEPENVGLWTDRVDVANEIAANSIKPCIYISVHYNAMGSGTAWLGGEGIEAFYYPGSELGELIARRMMEEVANLTGRKMRRYDAEYNFYELKGTTMPAVITENGFFTHYEEAKLIWTKEYRQKVAKAHFNVIKSIEDEVLA